MTGRAQGLAVWAGLLLFCLAVWALVVWAVWFR